MAALTAGGTQAEICREGDRTGGLPFVRQPSLSKQRRRQSSFTSVLSGKPFSTEAGPAPTAAFLDQHSVLHSGTQTQEEATDLEVQVWGWEALGWLPVQPSWVQASVSFICSWDTWCK